MKLSEIFNSSFAIRKEKDHFLFIKDENVYEIKINDENDDFEMILRIIIDMEKKDLTELNQNGIQVRKKHHRVTTSSQISSLSPDEPHVITRSDNRQEVFGRQIRKLHPDIEPDFDQNIYKGKTLPKGMIMGPDDEYFKQQIKKEDDTDQDVRVPDFAKYDPILPSRNKRTGPNPDHLRKPGNFPDDPDLF